MIGIHLSVFLAEKNSFLCIIIGKPASVVHCGRIFLLFLFFPRFLGRSHVVWTYGIRLFPTSRVNHVFGWKTSQILALNFSVRKTFPQISWNFLRVSFLSYPQHPAEYDYQFESSIIIDFFRRNRRMGFYEKPTTSR